MTEGIGDPVEGFTHQGAHDQLARRLATLNPNLKYVNLAQRGLLTQQIRETQLEPAVTLNPDLISVIAGANDLLMRQWNPDTFETNFAVMLGAFPARTQRLTMTLPNFSIPLNMPPTMKARFERQWAQANHIIRRVAQQHDALLLDVAANHEFHLADVWSADQVHPNARGYALTAQAMWELLELP